jgi:hypothetical protein
MAYPFVRPHQPSAFYGVNSLHFGSDTIDQVGWNEGLYELATAGGVRAYYDHVMRQRFLPTGRVSYFPMSEYHGHGRFTTLAGTEYTVNVARRIVDATYVRVAVPSMRPPPYRVGPGIECVPPNDLPRLAAGERYVVVGGGKTGIDTCLRLLGQGIAPDRLIWIMPRDSWLLDRATIHPERCSPTGSRPASPRNCGPSGTRNRSTICSAVSRMRARCCGSTRRSGPPCTAARPSPGPNSSSCDASPMRCAWATCCASTPTEWSSTVERCHGRLGALRRLHRPRCRKAARHNHFQYRPDHVTKRARMQTSIQLRAGRPSRGRLPGRQREEPALRAVAAPGHRPRLVAHRTGRLRQSTALAR